MQNNLAIKIQNIIIIYEQYFSTIFLNIYEKLYIFDLMTWLYRLRLRHSLTWCHVFVNHDYPFKITHRS